MNKVVALLFLFLLTSFPACAATNAATRVILGLTIDRNCNIVAADPQIEYMLPKIEKHLSSQSVLEKARYLPPLYLNHENIVTGTDPVTLEYVICADSILKAFRHTLIKYIKNCKPDDYVLLIAKRTLSDARPLISVWWFTYIHKNDLPWEY